MVRVSFVLLLISLCLFGSLSVKTQVPTNDTEEVTSSIFMVFHALLHLNGQLPSYQIYSCFSDKEKESLFNLTSQLLTLGLELNQDRLQDFPYVIREKVGEKLKAETINCLVYSNDFQLLKWHFGVNEWTIEQFQTKLIEFVRGQSQDFQLMLKNLSMAIALSDFKTLGKLLNLYGHYIFGKRKDDPWTVRVQRVQNLTEYFGVSVSNGVIGAISSRKPLTLSQTVIGGAYDKIGRGRVDNIVQTFPVLHLELSCGQHYYNFVQELNLKKGKMSSSFSTPQCSVSYDYFAVKSLPFAFLTNIKITSHIAGEIVVKNIQQAPSYLNDIRKSYENIDTPKETFSILHSRGTTKSGKLDICIASSFLFDKPLSQIPSARVLHEDWDSNAHWQKFKKTVVIGQVISFSIITSLITSKHHSDPENQALRMVIRGVSLGPKKMIQMHEKQWENLWKSDIIIEGNDADQKNIRIMLYHFYAFLNPLKSYGLSPMGLSGLGYNGHVFWDMDLWMYPAILALRPQLAKTLVQYRIQRLAAAQNNAFINGYKGSMYPWESSESGEEETPIWALTGPLEHHISGCVAFGVWNYYLVTQDEDWLKEEGYKVIESVAQFWESRVEFNEKDGLYHINNVVGADQWAQNINDDAFTNAIAKKSFQIANKARQLLDLQPNTKWDQISNKIPILKLKKEGVTKQHSSYQGQAIKQADANLLSFPLSQITDPAAVLRDLQYYETRIPDQGTPAMTFAIFTILYSRLQNPQKAYKTFKQSFEPFLRKPFNVFAETKGGNNPYFMTGAGGVLQSVIFGFGGYEITQNGLEKIKTAKPVEWTSLTIKGFLSQQ